MVALGPRRRSRPPAVRARPDFSIALIVGYGLRPSRQRPGHDWRGTAMEISRFPCKRLLRMPGSTTTRGRHVSCDIDTSRVAFCGTENISTPNLSYAAQYLACALSCERFKPALAYSPCITRVRYGSLHTLTVTDFHLLPFAGLPAHPSTALTAVIDRRFGCLPKFPCEGITFWSKPHGRCACQMPSGFSRG